jgi:potassium-transporting ATPase KdpC subunit
MKRVPHWAAQAGTALRVVAVLTVLLGLGYPLALLAAAHSPGCATRQRARSSSTAAAT